MFEPATLDRTGQQAQYILPAELFWPRMRISKAGGEDVSKEGDLDEYNAAYGD